MPSSFATLFSPPLRLIDGLFFALMLIITPIFRLITIFFRAADDAIR